MSEGGKYAYLRQREGERGIVREAVREVTAASSSLSLTRLPRATSIAILLPSVTPFPSFLSLDLPEKVGCSYGVVCVTAAAPRFYWGRHPLPPPPPSPPDVDASR